MFNCIASNDSCLHKTPNFTFQIKYFSSSVYFCHSIYLYLCLYIYIFDIIKMYIAALADNFLNQAMLKVLLKTA